MNSKTLSKWVARILGVVLGVGTFAVITVFLCPNPNYCSTTSISHLICVAKYIALTGLICFIFGMILGDDDK